MTTLSALPVFPDLAGKAVLITGASTGIGAAAARAFGRNKAKVAVNYNSSREAAEAVVADIKAAGGEAILAAGDVTRPETAQRLIEQTVAAFGRLDVLVNNAGALVKRTPIAEYTDAFVDAVLDVNVRHVVRFMREGAAQMRRQGGGPGSVVYAAAKGFVAVATRGWAKELVGDRIRVNAVSPGVITTPFHERFSTPEQLATMQAAIPMKRLGEAEDCAAAFLYLASEAASGYVTGQMVEINGGQSMP
jgi:3-oxoacyl-[acyl-carrier protein] reductase